MGSETRARLGLAAVLLITLLSFNQLFEPGDYPGPALLGMLLATGIAVGARRLGLGGLVTLLASGVGLAAYVAFVFQTNHTFFGLPTRGAIERVLSSVQRAAEFSQIDFAPVPVRPGYVILVVAGMWAAAAVGELATFRWKRPLLAVLPAVVLFSVSMVVGSGDGAPILVVFFLAALLTFWGLESSHRLRTWGRWVATWPDHAEEEPDSVTGSLARRMGAGCLAAALVAPLFLPALGDGLVRWRTEIGRGLGSGGGGGSSGQIDPLVSIAPSVVNQSDMPLFRVRAAAGSYWRLVALPHFDGQTWSPPGGDENVPVEGRIEGSWIPAHRSAAPLEQEISLLGLSGRFLPAAGQAVEVVAQERQDDLRFHPLTGDLRLEGSGASNFSYTVTSLAAAPTFAELRNAPVGVTDRAFHEMQDLAPEVIELLNRWIEGETTPYGRLVAIQDALRSADYTYSLESQQVEGGQRASADELTRFLLETRTGYCQQFATAFAALSRSLGYPTRVVVGFLPGEPTGENEYLVKGTDAHAWPEVYFQDFGWIRFEPTPRADNRVAAVPDYTTAAPGATAGALGTDGGAGRAQASGSANQGALDARALNDAEGTGSAIQLQELTGGDEGGVAGDTDAETNAAWERTFRRLVLILIAALAVGMALIPAIKAVRIRRAYKDAAGARALVAAAFREFMLEAGELAAPKSPAESARAYVERIAGLKNLPSAKALRLAALYERALYSPGEPEPQSGTEARSIASDLRDILWHRASLWERGARLFSLGPLRRPL